MSGFPILTGERTLLDSMTFIYFLEQHPKFGRKARSVFAKLRDGKIRGIASTLVFAEILVHPYRKGDRDRAAATFDSFNSFPNLGWVDLTPPIAREAARLRAEYGLRTPDAIHVATGLDQEVDWLISNDRNWKRLGKKEGVKVWQFGE